MGFLDDTNWSNLPGYGTDLPSTPDLSSLGSPIGNGFLGLPSGVPSKTDYNSIIQQMMAGQGSPNMQMQGGLKNPNNAADLASVLGAFSSGEKSNRIAQGNMTQGYDKLMLDAQQGRNANESDALKKLAQTNYITGGGSTFKPAALTLNGVTHTPVDLGYGPKPTTPNEIAGAGALNSQLQARLSPGGSYTPQPLNDYAKPGIAENIGSYGAAGVGGLGSIMNAFGNSGGQSDPTSGITNGLKGVVGATGTIGSMLGLAGKIPGLGGAAASGAGAGASGAGAGLAGTLGTIGKLAGPIAGGAAGAYGLAKNASTGSDIMSGAGAGASIGSLGGPIGMAAGAGIGALVGALRGLFSVTGKEQGGRDAQTTATSNLAALSTPAQQAEASKAGWPDPKQALSLIVMRDKLTQSGMPPDQASAQAESIMKNMWGAEKSGASSVQQAASPIQAMMQGQGAPVAPGSFVTDAFSQGANRG